MIAIPDMHGLSQEDKKENNLLKFRQPSVPEKKKKIIGHVKIIPIPAWGNVRCVASWYTLHISLFSDNELAFAVNIGSMDPPKSLPIEPAEMIRLGLFCDPWYHTELEMGMARGEAMGEQVAGHDEEQ
jgi:hypothetical protein